MNRQESLELPIELLKKKQIYEVLSKHDKDYAGNIGFIHWLYDNNYEIKRRKEWSRQKI